MLNSAKWAAKIEKNNRKKARKEKEIKAAAGEPGWPSNQAPKNKKGPLWKQKAV